MWYICSIFGNVASGFPVPTTQAAAMGPCSQTRICMLQMKPCIKDQMQSCPNFNTSAVRTIWRKHELQEWPRPTSLQTADANCDFESCHVMSAVASPACAALHSASSTIVLCINLGPLVSDSKPRAKTWASRHACSKRCTSLCTNHDLLSLARCNTPREWNTNGFKANP